LWAYRDELLDEHHNSFHSANDLYDNVHDNPDDYLNGDVYSTVNVLDHFDSTDDRNDKLGATHYRRDEFCTAHHINRNVSPNDQSGSESGSANHLGIGKHPGHDHAVGRYTGRSANDATGRAGSD
jgi:hypothetical protein